MIWWIGLLFVSGMVLVLAEFILPGAILGIAGGILLCICAGLGFVYYPEYAFALVIAEIIGVVASIGAGMYIMANTNIGKSLHLDKTQNEDEGYTNQKSDLTLLEKTGTVMTALRPAGTIIIDGNRIDAVSNGSMINKGDTVKVIEVHGNRVVVEKTV